MSTQETHSQPPSQSQQQSQCHTEFLVNIATENASLKVQIKQEYDNSYAIVHQVNKSIREIDSCKRDLTKFNELREMKVSELKRLESDLEILYDSIEGNQNNTDYLKKQEEQMLLEEEQKKADRKLVAENYERMIKNQKEINAAHPLVIEKNEVQSLFQKHGIHKTILKGYVDSWRRKEYQIQEIHSKRLNGLIVDLANVFITKRLEHCRKVKLINQLSEEKLRSQNSFESKQSQRAMKSEETVIFLKPTPPDNISKDFSRLRSSVTPKFYGCPKNLTAQSDLFKHFQQVSAFKTAHPNQFVLSSKLLRPFSPRNVNLRSNMLVNNRGCSKLFPEERPFYQSAGNQSVEKIKSVSEFTENKDSQKEFSDGLKSVAEKNLPKSITQPVDNDADFISQETDDHAPNNEVAAINFTIDVTSGIGVPSVECNNSIRNLILNNRAPSVSISNCSTPVSSKSGAGSQKGKTDYLRSRNFTIKSPRPVDSSRKSFRFSPILKIPQSPKMSLKGNTAAVGSWKPYRTPDILLKMANAKQQSLSWKISNVTPIKHSKPTKIDLALNPVSCAPKSKPKKVDFEETVDPYPAELDVIDKTVHCKITQELGKFSLIPDRAIQTNERILESPVTLNEHSEKVPSNEGKNINTGMSHSNLDEVPINEQSHSKYFVNADQPCEGTNNGDINCPNDSHRHENSPTNNENISIGSVDDTSKPNSIGSNDQSSHFSSTIMKSGNRSNFSPSSPMSNFMMPFALSNENAGGIFGNDNTTENEGFSLTSELKGNSNNSGFSFNFAEEMTKQTFSLF